MKAKDAAILALYTVGLAIAALCFALNILGTIPLILLVLLLAIGMFSLSVAGIMLISERK